MNVHPFQCRMKACYLNRLSYQFLSTYLPFLAGSEHNVSSHNIRNQVVTVLKSKLMGYQGGIGGRKGWIGNLRFTCCLVAKSSPTLL